MRLTTDDDGMEMDGDGCSLCYYFFCKKKIIIIKLLPILRYINGSYVFFKTKKVVFWTTHDTHGRSILVSYS